MIGLVKKLLRHTSADPEYVAQVAEVAQRREDLDARLQELTRATLDHEGSWFLTILRKDPDCALKVFDECSTKGH